MTGADTVGQSTGPVVLQTTRITPTLDPLARISLTLDPTSPHRGEVVEANSVRFVVVLGEDAVGGALHILELAGARRPQEGGKTQPAENKRHRDQHQKIGHAAGLSAFKVTVSEEDDMATAARGGAWH